MNDELESVYVEGSGRGVF